MNLSRHSWRKWVSLLENKTFGWVPAIWLAPNKVLLNCLTNIWLSSCHIAGIQPKKSNRLAWPLTKPSSLHLAGWAFDPASQIWLPKFKSGWKNVSSISKIVQPCSKQTLKAKVTGLTELPEWPKLSCNRRFKLTDQIDLHRTIQWEVNKLFWRWHVVFKW